MIMGKRNISGDFSSWYKISSYVKPKSPTQCDVVLKCLNLLPPKHRPSSVAFQLHLLSLNLTLFPLILIGYR